MPLLLKTHTKMIRQMMTHSTQSEHTGTRDKSSGQMLAQLITETAKDVHTLGGGSVISKHEL